jgi:hypothetical protein
MATDGIYSKDSPNYPSQNTADAFDEIKENFTWLERELIINGTLTGLASGHYSQFTYNGELLSQINVYASGGGTPIATATLNYTGANIASIVWNINGKTITQTFLEESGRISRITITIA